MKGHKLRYERRIENWGIAENKTCIGSNSVFKASNWGLWNKDQEIRIRDRASTPCRCA